MTKKTISLVGVIVGFAFVLVGILSFCGALGGNASSPNYAPYNYDTGYATFGADYYTYSVNNTAETADAAQATAYNLRDIAVFLKTFCGLFSICFGLVIVCCFGIYRAGLNEKGISVADDTTSVEAEKVVTEETEDIGDEELTTKETTAGETPIVE